MRDYGPDADVDIACTNFAIAQKLRSRFEAIYFIPMPNVELFGTQSNGPLDRKSVMLYPSSVSVGVLFWKDPTDGTKEYPILANHFPSAGDVAAVKAMYPDHELRAGSHWEGDRIVKDEPQAATSRSGPPVVPPKPSSLRASKIRPSVPAKPTRLQIDSSTTVEPLSQILRDVFGTKGQTSPTDVATVLDMIEN